MKHNPIVVQKRLQQLKTAAKNREILLHPSFPKQNAFIEDPSRYIDVQCSRRAGKTNGLGLRFFKTMERHPRSQCVYLALTLESAKDIMWPVMQELDERFAIGCTFTESNTTVTHPNGSKLRILGADMQHFVKRLKGRKYPGIGVDEAQDFGSHLQSLIDDVLTPSIADYEDGWIAITGTPGPVPQGYFFEVTQGRKYGYSHHEWTILDNPYMPNPEKFIADLMERREWDNRNPTLLREWRNQWVLDVQSLWVNYSASKNHYLQLPPGQAWRYVVGVDVGFKDADAISVLAFSDASPTTYLVSEIINHKQGITELVEQIQQVIKTYNPDKIVFDEGGGGKKMAEELRRRYGIPVHPAEKTRKQEAVEILNDALRTGKLMAKSDSRFAQDSYLVQIDWEKSTPDKIVIKKTPHSDIIDSVLYAFRESPAYSYTAPMKEPKPGTPEWFKKQTDSMFEQAVEHFNKEVDLNKSRDPFS
jgi:hypothetical protein